MVFSWFSSKGVVFSRIVEASTCYAVNAVVGTLASI
jgi:hypothetical protein